MSAHETALNTFETSVVGRAVSPCKTCVHSSKNHDPARKCDRLYTLLYLKHDQIHISIAYRCILCTEHFNFYLFNQTPLCTSQSCFYPLAKGAFAGLTRAWVENKSLTVCDFLQISALQCIIGTRPASFVNCRRNSNGCLFDSYTHQVRKFPPIRSEWCKSIFSSCQCHTYPATQRKQLKSSKAPLHWSSGQQMHFTLDVAPLFKTCHLAGLQFHKDTLMRSYE